MENQRIRLSKKMLKDSLIRLLQHQKDIQTITIHEICQGAQINRTTFYKYYGSQYDLLDDIEKDIFLEMEACLINCDASVNQNVNEGLVQALSYLEKEREKCLFLINASTDKQFADKLFSLPFIQDLIYKSTPKEYLEEEVKYMHALITHGGYAVIRIWINKEHRETPKEMSRILQKMMYSLIFQ